MAGVTNAKKAANFRQDGMQNVYARYHSQSLQLNLTLHFSFKYANYEIYK